MLDALHAATPGLNSIEQIIHHICIQGQNKNYGFNLRK